MAKYTGRFRLVFAPAALAAALVITACGGDSAKADTMSLGGDAALANDLAMANRDTTTRIQLNDVPPPSKSPASPRPAAPRPATPRPAAPAPSSAMGTIAAGTSMTLASNKKVCTNDHKAGDQFTASTTQTITGTNGVSIPAGADVTLEVTKLSRSDNVKDPVVMEFRVVSVKVGARSYALSATYTGADIDRVKDQPKDKDVQKVVGGAVVGAIAGQILGKNTRSTVAGAAVGAAAGAGVAATTANFQGCINAGSRITVQLEGPVEIIRV